MPKNAASILTNKLPKVLSGVSKLSLNATFVGVPSDKTTRKDNDTEKGPMTNAALAFIHDNGSEAAHIPARPFMRPGVARAQKYIVAALRQGAQAALQGGDPLKYLGMAGLKTQAEIRAVINEGIAPPLADATLRERLRRRTSIKGAKLELAARAAGQSPSIENAKPLIATAQLRNAINYVIRKNK